VSLRLSLTQLDAIPEMGAISSHAMQAVAMSMCVTLSRGMVPAKRHAELLEEMSAQSEL
jgi:hypothetical protein